jgi:hypothetical protein
MAPLTLVSQFHKIKPGLNPLGSSLDGRRLKSERIRQLENQKNKQMEHSEYLVELINWHKKKWREATNSKERLIFRETIEHLNKTEGTFMLDPSYVDYSNIMQQAFRDYVRHTGTLAPDGFMGTSKQELDPVGDDESVLDDNDSDFDPNDEEDLDDTKDQDEEGSAGSSEDDDERDESNNRGRGTSSPSRKDKFDDCFLYENFMQLQGGYTKEKCHCGRQPTEHPRCVFSEKDFGNYSLSSPPECPGCKAIAPFHKRTVGVTSVFEDHRRAVQSH